MPPRHATWRVSFLIKQIKTALTVKGVPHNGLAGVKRERATDVASANDFEQPGASMLRDWPGRSCRRWVHA
jgi:hypothetical protein